jgi:hypothetical protein
MSLTKLSLGRNNNVTYKLFSPWESFTKLSLGRNNDVIYKLFSSRESLVSYIPAGDENVALANLFYGVHCTINNKSS